MSSSKVTFVLPLLAAACSAPRSLPETIRDRIDTSDAEVVGVYFRDVARADSMLIDADVRMHAASTMKVPVMIQIFRDAEAGLLSLDDSIVVTNTFHSIVDGSTYGLSGADDSDTTLYGRVGWQATIRQLVELMITVSSNLATNMLIELVDGRRVTQTMRALGADSIEVLRGVEDIKAYEAGLSNTTTARDLGVIMGAIAHDRAASSESCRAMEAILARQQFNGGIPAGLPAGTTVAHKTGTITRIHHDAALVTGRRGERYVLVVLVKGIADAGDSAQLMADIARFIHPLAG